MHAPVNEPNTNCTLNQSIKKKPVKPAVLKRLLRRSVGGSISIDPLGTLLSLVERDSFHIDIVNENKTFHATISIGGTIFESVAQQKKEARNAVIVKALKCTFADAIEEMRLEDEKLAQSIVPSTASINLDILPLELTPAFLSSAEAIRTELENPQGVNARKRACQVSNENDNCGKKMKLDSVQASGSYSVNVRKEIREPVLERLVQQALGLTDAKNPNTVTALHSLFDKESFSFRISIPHSTRRKFVCDLYIEGRRYTDIGESIKKARTNVAKKALRHLFPKIAHECEVRKTVENCVRGKTSGRKIVVECSKGANGEFSRSVAVVKKRK